MSNDHLRTPEGATEATMVLGNDELREARGDAGRGQFGDRAAERARQRAERDRALGRVQPPTGPEPVLPVVHKPTTDRFLPSLGLFLLRLVTAAIMGVHGFQKLTDIAGTQAFLTGLGLPSPRELAWAMGIAEVLAAVSLVFGLLVRLAGLGIAVVAVGALALVLWGSGNPFQAGKAGFVGELELLLAGVGLLLLCVGGGRWGIDGQFRANRRRSRMRG